MTRVVAGGVCIDRRVAVRRLEIGVKHIVEDVPRLSIGGGAANNAIALKALAPERRVLLFAFVGGDDLGTGIRRFMDDRRVEMPLAPLSQLPTSESVVVSESECNGRGTILSIAGARSQELPLDPIKEALAEAEAFCLCAPSNNQQIAPLLAASRAAFVPAYFALGSAQIHGLSYAALSRQLQSSVELVICNRHEAAKVTGATSVEQQLRAFRFGGRARAAVVTCGEDGLWGFDNLGIYYEPAYRDRTRPIVSDTGAGDAAAAAVIDSLVRGLTLEEALACGARNGFEACTGFGLEHVCRRLEMDALLENRRRMAA
jgi:sugar/nucleoside kinase (ribokinase family)